MVAELAKTQGNVQHRHTPNRGDRPAENTYQKPMYSRGDHGWQTHR
jgi:hypothetical protein